MNMDKEALKKTLKAGGGPAALIATCAGFFCDFVKPFINFVPYFFFISLIVSLIIWRFVLTSKLRHSPLEQILSSTHGKVFGIAVVSTAFWLVMVPIFALTPAEGVAASVSPDISGFQQQLFGKLDRIETKIDQGFEKVLSKIDQIDANAGLIAEPKTPNDYYHNARFHEINGNLIEAKKAYEKYFEADLVYLDPYISYSLILKNLEGVSTAREMMGKVRGEDFNNPSVNLAYILMKESREDKVALLKDLAEKNPDYGPVYYYLGEQYSYKETGSNTNAERKNERDAFQKLMDLEKEQKFSKFFVDKKMADELMTFARQEMNALSDETTANIIDEAIQFRIDTNNNQTTITFTLSELAKKIYYRVDGQGDFIDTGTMGVNMIGMKDPLPNYYATLSLPMGDHYVEAKYVDLKDNESPVYKHEFKIEKLGMKYPPYKLFDANGKEQYMILWGAIDDGQSYDYYYSVDDKSLSNWVDNGGAFYLTGLSKGKHTVYMQGVSDSGKTNLAEMTFEAN